MLFYRGRQRILDSNGDPVSGAKLNFYLTGTTTRADTYTDSDLTTEHANPVIASSAGFVEPIYLDPTVTYKCVITTSNDVTLPDGTVDPVSSSLEASSIGAALYQRSTAEIAASVTPTNYAYEPGDVRRYGAVGDGVTDDATAIQAALTVAQDVYIPETSSYYAVSSVLTLSTVGQRVYGDGIRSRIVQSGTNANANVFKADTLNGVRFEGLNLTPGTTLASTFQGFGIYCDDCDFVHIERCTVTAARRGGFGFLDCNNCTVVNNVIRDSIVNPATDTQSDTGFDIYLGGACSYNTVRGNQCIGGSGVGVGVQTLTSGDDSNHNVIDGNVIKDQDAYGIMLYILNAADNCDRNVISNNQIDTVTGDITQDDLSDIYGAGIFVQTAEHTVITGNVIRNTNSSGGTPPTTGLPAAIALNGTIANAVITGNLIETSGYYGIAFSTASAITHGGRGFVIEGNTVRDTANAGIYLNNCVRAIVKGNNLDGVSAAAQGIYIRQDTISQSDDFIVSGNLVNDYGVGILTGGTISRVVVNDNIVRGNTGYGIYNVAAFTNCHDNVVINGTGGDGIGIGAAAVNGFCRSNFVQGGDYGYVDDAGGTLRFEDNQYSLSSAPTTPHSTSQWRVLADSATPDVRNARWVSIANTTSITDFANGYRGQVLTIKALANFTVTDNATIVLAGAANFAMVSGDTLTLVKDGSAWTELSRGDN